MTRDINSFKNANTRTINGVHSKGRRESIERQMNAGLAGLKTYKKQREEKYSKKWDKKVEKEERKIADKIEKRVTKGRGSVSKVYDKMTVKLKNNPDIKKFKELKTQMNNKKVLNIDEVNAMNKAYDKAALAQARIIREHQEEMTKAALQDLGFTPTKAAAKKYTARIKKKYS